MPDLQLSLPTDVFVNVDLAAELGLPSGTALQALTPLPAELELSDGWLRGVVYGIARVRTISVGQSAFIAGWDVDGRGDAFYTGDETYSEISITGVSPSALNPYGLTEAGLTPVGLPQNAMVIGPGITEITVTYEVAISDVVAVSDITLVVYRNFPTEAATQPKPVDTDGVMVFSRTVSVEEGDVVLSSLVPTPLAISEFEWRDYTDQSVAGDSIDHVRFSFGVANTTVRLIYKSGAIRFNPTDPEGLEYVATYYYEDAIDFVAIQYRADAGAFIDFTNLADRANSAAAAEALALSNAVVVEFTTDNWVDLRLYDSNYTDNSGGPIIMTIQLPHYGFSYVGTVVVTTSLV